MGGGSGGGQQTTVTKNEPPAYLQPYYTDVAQQAQSLFQKGAPAYYPGQTVAPTSEATLQALEAIKARAGGDQPLLSGAANVYQNVLDPSYTDVTNDPRLRAAMDYANSATVDQFKDATVPGITGTFSQAGRLSSGAVGNTLGNASDALSRTLAGSNNQIILDELRNRQNQQLQTAANAPTLANAQYDPAQMLAAAGATEEGNAQNLINADIQKYNYNANAQKLNLQDYINLLQGTAGGQGVSTATGPATNQNSTLGILGALGGAGSLLTGIGSLFSDRRLKTNIVYLGTDDRNRRLYAWTYLWGDAGVGVMADEVPHAASIGPGGFARVDYGRV